LARSVVFRWFAQPLLRRKRAEIYAGVRAHLRYLDANPDAQDRAERIAAMVACPEPLVRLLGQRIARPGGDVGPLLEVMTRRYYREVELDDLRVETVDRFRVVHGRYRLDGRDQRVVATAADFELLTNALAAAEVEAGDDLAVDL